MNSILKQVSVLLLGVVGLMNVITGLSASDNGKFYDYQGNELLW